MVKVLLTGIVSFLMCLSCIRHKVLLDVPNDRSSHTNPVSKGGGLTIIVGVLIASKFNIFLGGALAMAFVGLLSDRYKISVLLRLILQVYISSAVVYITHSPPILILWLIIMTNFFNFMDGINGLAGMQALVVCLFFGEYGLIAALVGFLIFNLRGKIFLGDTGSYFLGFYLASFALRGHFLPLAILMFVFILDPTIMLIVKVFKRIPLWQPHNDHFYQRLVKRGWTHLQVTAMFTGVFIILMFIAKGVR